MKTTPASLTLAIVRIYRVALCVKQSEVAKVLNKTTSAWTKVEIGQSQITLNTLFAVCNFLAIAPNDLMQRVSIGMLQMSQKGWQFVPELPLEEDDLFKKLNDYLQDDGRSLFIEDQILDLIKYFCS